MFFFQVAFKVGERVKITGNTSGGSDKFSAMLGAVVEARSGGAFGVRLDNGAGYTYFTESSLQVTDEAPKAVEAPKAEEAPKADESKPDDTTAHRLMIKHYRISCGDCK